MTTTAIKSALLRVVTPWHLVTTDQLNIRTPSSEPMRAKYVAPHWYCLCMKLHGVKFHKSAVQRTELFGTYDSTSERFSLDTERIRDSDTSETSRHMAHVDMKIRPYSKARLWSWSSKFSSFALFAIALNQTIRKMVPFYTAVTKIIIRTRRPGHRGWHPVRHAS